MQLFVGSLWNFAFQLYDQTNNRAIDVTAMTFECDIQDGNRREIFVTLTLGSGITVLSAVDGIIQIALTSTQTTALGPGAIIGSFWRTDTDRQILWAFEGVIEMPASTVTYYPGPYYTRDYSWGMWP